MKANKINDNFVNYEKIEEFLQKTIYFENFPLASVSKIAANCFLKELPFNSSFLTSTESTNEMYFIYEGSLNVTISLSFTPLLEKIYYLLSIYNQYTVIINKI